MGEILSDTCPVCEHALADHDAEGRVDVCLGIGAFPHDTAAPSPSEESEE